MRKRRVRRCRSARRSRMSRGTGRNNGTGNSMMKFTAIIGIMLIAVVCGYGTARFVLAPILGYDTEVLKLDFPSKITSAISSGLGGESKEEKSDNYALQFGVFQNRDGAMELKNQLISEGIDVTVREEDGKYKVISPLISSKKEALNQLKEIKTGGDKDVFITGVDEN
ncbi:MAG: SPOR domain-containing protein [Firmicutes bacterium]|nr:SPOR domain-containing protein [Bacillota bacterium]